MDFDIKAIVDKTVDKVQNDPKFMENFKKDPEKTIESIAGVDIPDGAIDKVVAAVKTKIGADKVNGILGKLGL